MPKPGSMGHGKFGHVSDRLYTVKQFRMAEIYNSKSVVKNLRAREQSTKYSTYACKNEDI